MKKILILLFPVLCWGQNFSIDPRSLSNMGNVELLKQIADNQDIDGSPYFEKSFSETIIEMKDGLKVQVMARLHMGASYFEIKGNNSELLKYTPDLGATVIYLNTKYTTRDIKPINALPQTVLVAEVIQASPYGLLINPRKKIEQPRKENIAMPSSGFSDPKNPKWVDASTYFLTRNNQYYLLEGNLKALWNSEILLPEHQNTKGKVKLKSESDMRKWIEMLNIH